MNNNKIAAIIVATSTVSSGFIFSKNVYADEIKKNEDKRVGQESIDNKLKSSVKKGKVVNVSSNLRVRQNPNTNSKIVGYLYNNEVVDIMGSEGSWYKIKFKGNSGYVHKDYIRVAGNNTESNGSQSSSKQGKVINISSNLRIRSEPNTNSKTLGTLRNGQTFKIKEKSGQWYHIEYNSIVGYIHGDYVSEINHNQSVTPEKPPSNDNQSNNGTQSMSGKGQVINVTTNLRLRQLPSTNSSVLGYLLNGDIFDVKGKNGSWYKISFSGKIGYIHGEYVKLINNNSNPNNNTNSNTNTGTNTENSSQKFDTVFNIMKKHIGSPYVYGGAGEPITKSLLNNLKKRFPSNANKGQYDLNSKYIDNGYRAFDCSGLMQWGFRQAGISIGRTTFDQIKNGVEISINSIKPGDLLFYDDLNHVGMYVGNDQWIESPKPGQYVRISSVPWKRVNRARRVI